MASIENSTELRKTCKRNYGRIRIIGRTQIGRATIGALNMNLPQRINLRRALLTFGEHPAEIG